MAHVTFIHGIGNKKEAATVLASWEFALQNGGLNLGAEGVTTSMVYWADVLYAEPLGAATSESAFEAITEPADDELPWIQAATDEEQAFVAALASTFNYEAEPPEGDDRFEASMDDQDGTFERVPLPWFIKRRLMKVLLRDVHHYLFNATSHPRPGEEYRVQDEIRRRFVETLRNDQESNPEGPHVVVSHSMGTVIAYDCLKRVSDCPPVAALMTIGGPLGIDEIQDVMRPEWTRDDGYPSATVASSWSNVYDRLDVVSAADPNIANDYKQQGVEVVNDVSVSNDGKWRHDIGKYLRQPAAAADLRRDARAMTIEHWNRREFTRRLAAAADNNDRQAAGRLVEELTAELSDADAPRNDADQAARVLSILRRKRYFQELGEAADAFQAAGQAQPAVLCQYGQALIEQGSHSAAIDLLERVADETEVGTKYNLEARGLLGRAHKQQYVDGARVAGEGAAADLQAAVVAYLGVYQEDQHDPDRLWHGINAVAVINLARRDDIPLPPNTPDSAETARSILERIEGRFDERSAAIWDFATAMEACVALQDVDGALRWALRYAQHPMADAFEFGSTLRQLEQVWQLDPGRQPGKTLLPVIQAALLRQQDGRLDLAADSELGGALESLTSDGTYEAILGNEMYRNLVWLEKALALAGSVARVRDSNGEPKGTAFVVRRGDIDAATGSPDELLLLTNAHVVSASEEDEPALIPAQVRISFERDDSGTVYEAEVAWSSPRGDLDATLIRTRPPLQDRTPSPIAARLPRLDDRVFIIGHPGYQPLSYSIYDNRLLSIEDPYLHYRTPTEGGSSGSPVFNSQWELIGLHHKGDVRIAMADGNGLQAANEGLTFEAVSRRAEGCTTDSDTNSP